MLTVNALASIGIYDFNLSEYGKLKTVGVTDEFTSCCCCGKEKLKKTVVMQDSGGNYSFFGTTCAYNASRGYAHSTNRTRKIHPQVMEEILETLKPSKADKRASKVKEVVNKAIAKGYSNDQALNLLDRLNGDLEKFEKVIALLD